MITSCFLQHSGELRREEINAVAEAGFDSIQFMFEPLGKMDDAAFKAFKRFLTDAGLRAVELVNPFPNDMALYSQTFDLGKYTDTLKRLFDRAAQLGGQLAEFAQRLSRQFPSDIAPGHQEQRAKLIECIHVGAELANASGLQLSIEPTSRISSNFCNSFGETIEILREANAVCAGFDADIHHMLANGEPYANIIRYKAYVKNVHLRAPFDVSPAAAPPTLDDGFDYAPFMNALKAMAYAGPITIEGRTFKNGFAADIRDSMRFLEHYGCR